MSSTDLASVPTDPPEPFTDRLRLAVAAYLARFKGSSREHTESDLRCYLAWCAERGLDPLAARRPHLELYIRWLQEICRFKPSTVSRRFSVTAGFYRTCVLDGIMEHSPAEHVRRPAVPAEGKLPLTRYPAFTCGSCQLLLYLCLHCRGSSPFGFRGQDEVSMSGRRSAWSASSSCSRASAVVASASWSSGKIACKRVRYRMSRYTIA